MEAYPNEMFSFITVTSVRLSPHRRRNLSLDRNWYQGLCIAVIGLAIYFSSEAFGLWDVVLGKSQHALEAA